MKTYIQRTSAISPQPTFDREQYLINWQLHDSDCLYALEPVYKGLIDPKLSRRMSRIIKMSVAASLDVLEQAGLQQPEAIVVGTGLGCIEDSERFLTDLIREEEGILSPTAFIQSTHNTVAGQIALILQCPHYNFTYTNRGHSFENALTDAHLLIQEGVTHVLLGAADEITSASYDIMRRMDCVKHKVKFGEGVAFFLLGNKPLAERSIYLKGIEQVNDLKKEEVTDWVNKFLATHNMVEEEIDAWVLGRTVTASDDYYEAIQRQVDPSKPVIGFKQISGEYFTASGFGMHLAVKMLEEQRLFDQTVITGAWQKPLQQLVLYSHHNEQNHTLIALGIE